MRVLFIIILMFSFRVNAFELAVTIDDLPAAGPEADGISRTQIVDDFLNAAKKNKLNKMYGFAVGLHADGMQERVEILKSWKKNGHYLGNHTYSHLDLTNVTDAEFKKDIEKNESLLLDHAETISELKVFRFPFLGEGETSDKRYSVRSYLKNRNYRTAQVSIELDDWAFNEAFTRCHNQQDEVAKKEIAERYLQFAIDRMRFSSELAKRIWGTEKKIPHILLLHLNLLNAKYGESLFRKIKEEGAQFADADKIIRDKFYDEDTTFVGATGKSYLMQAKETRNLKWSDLIQPKLPKEKLKSYCQKI